MITWNITWTARLTCNCSICYKPNRTKYYYSLYCKVYFTCEWSFVMTVKKPAQTRKFRSFRCKTPSNASASYQYILKRYMNLQRWVYIPVNFPSRNATKICRSDKTTHPGSHIVIIFLENFIYHEMSLKNRKWLALK